MMNREVSPMADETSQTPVAGSVVEMPWVLISNQIQQLNTNINQRFTDERIRMDDRFTTLTQRMDDRFAAQEKRIDDRFEQVTQRFDQVAQRFDQVDKRIDTVELRLGQRIDQVDKRLDGLEARLTFRNSTWLTIILALLTLILGVLLAPHL